MQLLIQLTLSIVIATSPQTVRDKVLHGIDSIPVLGTPGTMCVWGDDAFPIIFGKDKASPIAVAAIHGKGRFFAIAHGSYVSGLQDGTGSQFMKQVVQWVGNKANPTIVTLNNDRSRWGGADILAFGQNMQLTSENETALLEWVRNGGGVIASACPWGWAQVTGKDLRSDLSQNRVMANLGMQYGGGYSRASGSGVFLIEDIPEESHAGVALQQLRKTGSCSAVGSNAILSAIQTAPASNHRFVDEVKVVVSEEGFSPPTRTKPLKSSETKSRIYTTLYSSEWKSLEPSEVTAAVGSEVFPGTVDPLLPRVSITRHMLDPNVEGWQSTGMYVCPGELVNVSVVVGDPQYWTLRIGCHKDSLWHKSSWQRWPAITYTANIENEMSVATPWGGLVYFIASKGAGDLTLSVSGVVEAPLFDVNAPAVDWRIERMNPAPWAEIKGNHMILSVPSSAVRELDNPNEVAEFWDEVVRSHCELAGIAVPPRPERFVADEQISAGYMHSGYPIMTWLDVATPKNGNLARVVDVADLKKRGSWGHFHELGHNRQRSWWTFSGTGEVTCNLFSLHAGEVLCGIEPWDNPWLKGQRGAASEYLKNGADFAKWKSSPGIALVSYAQLQKEFGWKPFTTVFKAFEAMSKSERPSKNQDKMDQWVRQMSIATKRDLRPFYLSWGMPLSTSLIENTMLDSFEPWMPEPI